MELKPDWTQAKTLHAHKYYRAFQTIRVDQSLPEVESILALCAFVAKPDAEVYVGDESASVVERTDVCVSQILRDIIVARIPVDDKIRTLYATSLERESEVREAYASDKLYTVSTPTSAIHALVLKSMFPDIHIRNKHKVEWLQDFM